MLLPTIYSTSTEDRHIVKDKNTFECGARYNTFPLLTRRDLRKIRFMDYAEVTCPGCKMSVIKGQYYS